MVDREDDMVLHDYAMPRATGANFSIMRPVIEAHNFELKPSLITFVERVQFGEHPLENPNIHLRNFLINCDTINLSGVCTGVIGLRLSHFL